jgi:hypothetical protein
MNYYHPKTNYGAFTDFSRALNDILGDKSGRSVSYRTAQGFRNLFNVREIEDENAEHIVHAGMLTAGALLHSKDEGSRTTGALLSFALFLCYQAGK